MGKTNWKRVFLGGLLAGVVFIVLGFAAYAIYLRELYSPAMEALGHPIQESAGIYVLSIVMSFADSKTDRTHGWLRARFANPHQSGEFKRFLGRLFGTESMRFIPDCFLSIGHIEWGLDHLLIMGYSYW